MPAYYNEVDPYAAQWLRNLIAAGHLADGVVDERSIEDVHPIELREFTQCHFFAGIGVWSRALRLAGWPDERPVWTGSCPCQPFSSAGKGVGFADERHLWPAFHHLIGECRPPVVFGEQVASKDGLAWLDLVRADLEATGYAAGAADLCAAGVGAPHIRQRLYWVADADQQRRLEAGRDTCGDRETGARQPRDRAGDGGPDDQSARLDPLRLPGADHQRRAGQRVLLRDEESGRNPSGVLEAARGSETNRPSPTNGHWRDADWLGCRDGKWRPVEPSTFPLAHGAPARVGRLRAYGNAIVPQVAATFVSAWLDFTVC